jgi:hypothetical protein
MVGTHGTIHTPSTFTLSLSSTFALFLCFHIRFHLPFLTTHICLLFSFTLFYLRYSYPFLAVSFPGEKSTASRLEERVELNKNFPLTPLWRKPYADEFS